MRNNLPSLINLKRHVAIQEDMETERLYVVNGVRKGVFAEFTLLNSPTRLPSLDGPYVTRLQPTTNEPDYAMYDVPLQGPNIIAWIDLIRSRTNSARFGLQLSATDVLGTDEWWSGKQLNAPQQYDQLVGMTRFFTVESVLGVLREATRRQEEHIRACKWANPWDNAQRIIDGLGNSGSRPFIHYEKVDATAKTRIAIIGDIHSSVQTLTTQLHGMIGDVFNDNTMVVKDDVMLVFAGDLADRGPYGIEVIALVMAIKLVDGNWEKVRITAGNHEDCNYFSRYGLTSEIVREYPNDWQQFVWNDNGKCAVDALRILHLLPSAIILNTRIGTYFACHGSFDLNVLNDEMLRNGGVSSDDIQKYRRIRNGASYTDEFRNFLGDQQHTHLMPPTDEAQLSHNDMHMGTGLHPSAPRGGTWEKPSAMSISGDLVRIFTQEFGIEMIISGHQDFVNLGLIPRDEKFEPFVVADALQDWALWWELPSTSNAPNPWGIDMSPTAGYDLKCIYVPNEAPEKFTLKLDNTAALVTSSASLSRYSLFMRHDVVIRIEIPAAR